MRLECTGCGEYPLSTQALHDHILKEHDGSLKGEPYQPKIP